MNTARIRLLVTFPLLCALVIALLAPAAAFGAETIGPRLIAQPPIEDSGPLANDQPYMPGEIIVQFKSGISAVASRSAHSRTGSVRTRAFSEFKGLEVARIASGKDVMAAVRAYEAMPEVAYAQPNYISLPAGSAPNDQYFNRQWGLHNTGQAVNGIAGTPDADVDILDAWDVTTGSPAVKVAVIDTGVDWLHEDITSNLWRNPGEIPDNGEDDDENGYVDDYYGYDTIQDDGDPYDENGHGTHVAGIIGAERNNGIGVAGVSPDVRLVAVKAGDPVFTTGSILAAFDYCAEVGARVINCSWGGKSFDGAQYAAMQAMPGHLFVCAAGNNNENIDDPEKNFYPAGYDLPNIVSVGATNSFDQRDAAYSNYSASKVDLFAPGTTIGSTYASLRFLTVDPGAITTISSDPFSTMSHWWSTSYGDTATQWSLQSGAYTSAPYSVGNAGYGVNEYNELFYAPGLDLRGMTNPGFRFNIKVDTGVEMNSLDSVIWGVWDESADTVHEVDGVAGNSGGFHNVAVDLSEFAGQDDIYPFIGLESDGVHDATNGVWIDDFEFFNASGPSAFRYAEWEPGLYLYSTGTSMAAPHVSGTAALLLARNSTLTTGEIKAVLMSTVDAKPALAGLCVTGGRLNTAAAVASVETLSVTGLRAIPAGDNEVRLEWEPVDGAESYQLYVDDTFVRSTSLTNFVAEGLSASSDHSFAVGWSANGYTFPPSDAVSGRTWGSALRLEQHGAPFDYTGAWLTWSSPTLSGGSYTYSNTSGSQSDITFDGTGLVLLARTGPEFGIARISVDEGPVTEVSLYEGSAVGTAWQRRVYATGDLAPGEHTVTIEYTGQKVPSATGAYINIDAVEIAPAVPPAFTGTQVEQDNGSVVLAGSWAPFAQDVLSGGSYSYANSAGAAGRLRFSGTRIALIARTGPEFGYAKVTVDGVARYVDLYSPTTKYQQSVFSTWELSDGNHVVSVEWTGRKNPASAGTYVNVDAFKIAGIAETPPALYQETDAAFAFDGAWSVWNNVALSGGSYAYTNATNAITRVSFDGSQIDLYARTGPEFGIASVSIYGGVATQVDLYSPTPMYQQKVFSADTTTDKPHTLAFARTGGKNDSATGTYVNIDSVEVEEVGPPAISGETRVQESDPRLAHAGLWSSWGSSALSGEQYLYSNTRAAQTTALFYGTRLDIIARTGPEFGYLKVTFDDSEVRYVDLYSPITKFQQRVYSTWPRGDGPHLVKMEWSGRKNPASTGTYVNIDALDIVGNGSGKPILPATGGTETLVQEQQDTTATLSAGWSTWTAGTDKLEGGRYAYTGVKDAVATFKTVNTTLNEYGAFTLISRMGPEFGYARIKVDGANVGIANLYSPVTLWKQEAFTWRLEPGSHTITVECTGLKDPAATGTYINVDAYKVWIPPVP